MKSHRTTLVLLLTAVILGVFLWADRDRITEDEKRRRGNNVFPAWRRDEVSRVAIERDEEALVLERDVKTDSPWRMRSPREDRADQAAVERLLTTLEFATVARKVDERAELGLDAPRVRGHVQMGGLVHRFALGNASPRPEGSSYLRVDDDPPIVISKELTQTLLRTSDAYRDRSVIPYLSLELARFEVRRQGGGFGLERLDEQSFRVASLRVRASREALDRVWGALGEMRAESFPTEADAERLTRDPTFTLRLVPKDATKPEAELVVGGACPDHPDDVVVLRKTPSRAFACAPKGALEALRAQPAELADTHPFSLRADEIEELTLELVAPQAVPHADAGAPQRAPASIEIARKGGGWRARAPLDRDLDPEEADAAGELVQRIAKSEAEQVMDGSDQPFVAVARARARGGDREELVEIGGPRADARVPLRRTMDGAVLDVAAAVARRLLPRATSLKPRAITEDRRRPTRVVLRCGAPQELSDLGGGFVFVAPKGYEADGSIVSLVDGLRSRADVWVADSDDGSFGFEGDGCRVVLAYADGSAAVTVHLGALGEGGVYGKTSEGPHVFVAPKALRELAGTIFVSRAALRVDPEEVESVRVTIDGRPRDVDPSVVRETLAGLYAVSVVAFDTKASLGQGPKRPTIEIEARLRGGKAKRITCSGPAVAERRKCVAEGVNATFAVAEARFLRLMSEGDGGAGHTVSGDAGAEVAPDGAPR